MAGQPFSLVTRGLAAPRVRLLYSDPRAAADPLRRADPAAALQEARPDLFRVAQAHAPIFLWAARHPGIAFVSFQGSWSSPKIVAPLAGANYVPEAIIITLHNIHYAYLIWARRRDVLTAVSRGTRTRHHPDLRVVLDVSRDDLGDACA